MLAGGRVPRCRCSRREGPGGGVGARGGESGDKEGKGRNRIRGGRPAAGSGAGAGPERLRGAAAALPPGEVGIGVDGRCVCYPNILAKKKSFFSKYLPHFRGGGSLPGAFWGRAAGKRARSWERTPTANSPTLGCAGGTVTSGRFCASVPLSTSSSPRPAPLGVSGGFSRPSSHGPAGCPDTVVPTPVGATWAGGQRASETIRPVCSGGHPPQTRGKPHSAR